MSADFEQALVKVLNDDAGVSALVGTRISVGALDVDITRPFVTVQRLNTEPSNTLAARNTITKVLFDIAANDDDLRGAYALATVVRSALENLNATVVTSDGSVVISGLYCTDLQQFTPRLGSATYRLSQFFSVWGEQT